MTSKRQNIKAILADPNRRRKLMVATIQAIQASAGIDTSVEQAERAYDAVRSEQLKREAENQG